MLFDEERFDLLKVDAFHQEARLDSVLKKISDLELISLHETKDLKETNKEIDKYEVEIS